MIVDECREQTRCPPHEHTECQLLMAVRGTVSPVSIRDLSTTGIGLVLHTPFETGTSLTIELINPSKKFSRKIPVRVVHACAQPGGCWLVGFQFNDQVSSEELQALL